MNNIQGRQGISSWTQPLEYDYGYTNYVAALITIQLTNLALNNMKHVILTNKWIPTILPLQANG